MLSNVTRHVATLLAAAVGLLGAGGVLYAWGLPPFEPTAQVTEDAYVRGKVTFLAPQVAGEVMEVAAEDFAEVEEGDLIIRLDDAIHSQRLAQAEAQLDAALEQTIAQLELEPTSQAPARSVCRRRPMSRPPTPGWPPPRQPWRWCAPSSTGRRSCAAAAS